MNYNYEIILNWSDDDNVFVATVPELPGCMAHGDTEEEARRQINLAMELWVDTAREFRRPIPQPKGERIMLGQQGIQKSADSHQAPVEDREQSADFCSGSDPSP
jgi:predicted RNase H-like HicB family nuclease